MYIEKFFNPKVSSTERVLYDKKTALDYCLRYYGWIRHYSFKENEYIRNKDGVLIWSDDSKVDINKLPNDKGWGKYFSELHNLCSF